MLPRVKRIGIAGEKTAGTRRGPELLCALISIERNVRTAARPLGPTSTPVDGRIQNIGAIRGGPFEPGVGFANTDVRLPITRRTLSAPRASISL